MKVLFLTAWYPTEHDKMYGLFVQKHAQALANQGVDVCVLYAEDGRGWARRMLKGWLRVKREWGLPDIVHLNVITKNGLLAEYLRRFYHIPYVIMEHWTGYLPYVGTYGGFFHKKFSETIASHAGRIMPVSADLAQAMQQCGLKGNYEVVHNVVDDFFFREVTETLPRGYRQIVHISCMDEPHKNVCGILRATKALSNQRTDFRLIIIGTGKDFTLVTNYARELGLDNNIVVFMGEKTPEEVNTQLREATFSLLFSNWENAPVVISESLAVGCPILSSDVGGIREMVDDQSGILIQAGDENALIDKMNYLLDHASEYDKDYIRKQGQQYSFDAVGQHLVKIYQSVIHP